VRRLLALSLVLPSLAPAQEAEIERALIQRDRQSAEFARPELRNLHLRQDMQQGPLRPDERVVQARERDAFPSRYELKDEASAHSRPLPLPGGPRPLVDPIPLQGVGG
jgi:hypothetical protein